MKSIRLAAACLVALASVSCSLESPPEWSNTPNPLDEPGEEQSIADDLHRKNIEAITQRGFRGLY
jgi:hypothetical protein